MRISDWSSDVCSSDLFGRAVFAGRLRGRAERRAVGSVCGRVEAYGGGVDVHGHRAAAVGGRTIGKGIARLARRGGIDAIHVRAHARVVRVVTGLEQVVGVVGRFRTFLQLPPGIGRGAGEG